MENSKNKYIENAIEFKKEILSFIEKEVLNKKFYLMLNNINLLQSSDSTILSSTALGFCFEEYLINILLEKFQNKKNFDFFRKYDSNNSKANTSSYDIGCSFNNEYFLINIKTCYHKKNEKSSSNNAVAAINILHKDYVSNKMNNKEKHFVVLKIYYIYENDYLTVDKCDFYYLEEVKLELENYCQDNRNWSKNLKKNSGRLIISDKYRETFKIDIKEMLHSITKKYIDDIYNNNEKTEEIITD